MPAFFNTGILLSDSRKFSNDTELSGDEEVEAEVKSGVKLRIENVKERERERAYHQNNGSCSRFMLGRIDKVESTDQSQESTFQEKGCL